MSPTTYTTVKDNGAVGNGVTDDYAAIQGTINNLETANGTMTSHCQGGAATLFFQAGAYYISQPLVTHCVSLLGTSAASSQIIVPGTDGLDVIPWQPSPTDGTDATPVHISRLGFHANGSTGGTGEPSAGSCISVTGSNVSIENVFTNQCYNAISWNGGLNLKVSESKLFANNRVFTANGGTNLWIYGVEALPTHPGDVSLTNHEEGGIYLTNTSGIMMTDVLVQTGRHGLVLSGAAQFFGKGISVDMTQADAGFSVDNSVDIECKNCWAAGSGTEGTYNATSGYGVSLTNTRGFRWDGGYIRENYLSGVHIGSGDQDIAFTNVQFSSNGHNNTTGQNTYGIYVDAPVGGSLRIQNNLFGTIGEDQNPNNAAVNASQTYAIYFLAANSPTASGLSMSGNSVTFGAFINTYTSPALIAGNDDYAAWLTGDGELTGSCTTGQFFSGPGSTGKLCAGGIWSYVVTAQPSGPTGSTCTVGQMWFDSTYAYFCTAPNNIRQVAFQ